MKKNIDEIDLQLLELLQRDASISQQVLAERVGISPATCLRRVQRLREAGILAAQVALVDPWALARASGQPPGLCCIVELSLDRQDAQALATFEQLLLQHPEVQQCWRVSAGPDFILVVHTLDMQHYQALAHALFTQQANVRNVKAYFATAQPKRGTAIPLPGRAAPAAPAAPAASESAPASAQRPQPLSGARP